MVDAAVETLREVDAVMLVHDASSRPGTATNSSRRLLKDVEVPVVLVLNKIDLVAKSRAAAGHRAAPPVARVHRHRPRIGRHRRRRRRARAHCCSRRCPKDEALYPDDYLTDQPQRVLVSETVREKVLHHTRDELPFSTAVVVDQFDEPDRPGGTDEGLLHDPRRDRVAEADRDRPRRVDDQEDRHRSRARISKPSLAARSISICASR